MKGAGYIKTYFVPLDEDFNLIRKENSIDFYRTEDRTRYYNIRNSMFDNISTGTDSVKSSYSTFDEVSAFYGYNDDIDRLDNKEEVNRNAVVTDEDSYTSASSEPEIKESRC